MSDNPVPLGSFGRASIGGHGWQIEPDEPHGAGGPVIDPDADPGPRPFGRKLPLPAPAAPPAPSTISAETLRALFGAKWVALHAFNQAVADAKAVHRRAIDQARQRLADLAARPVPAQRDVARVAADQLATAKLELAALERAQPDPCDALKEAAKVAMVTYETARKAARGV